MGGLITHHVFRAAYIPPLQAEGPAHVAHFASHILQELVHGGGGREVQSDAFIDGLAVGGVLDYAQHSRLIGSILYLEEMVKGRRSEG